MPRFSGIHHLALTVSDLEASVAFYELVFEFAPAMELGGENLHRRLFSLPGGTNLGLTQHHPTTTESFTPFRPGLDHVGFAVDSTDDIHEWADHLTAVGITHSAPVDVPYGTALSFKDPDGIALEFFVGT